MNSLDVMQYDETDEIEYIGEVTLKSVKLSNGYSRNVLTDTPRKSLDDPASIPKKTLEDVNNNYSKVNPETIRSREQLINRNSDEINNNAIEYPPPPCTFSSLIILILINTEHKSLTYYHLRDIICGLFPYYKKEELYKKMIHKIAVATTSKKSLQNKGQFFLKNLLDRQSQKLLPQLIQGLTKISITYENENPIITIIPSFIPSKITNSNEVSPVYYPSNEIEEQRIFANDKTKNKRRVDFSESSIHNLNESGDSLPDLSSSNTRKKYSDYIFHNEQPIKRHTLETLGISPNIETDSKKSAICSQSNNPNTSTSLKLVQGENEKRKISQTAYSSKDCQLQCNKSVLNECNQLQIDLGRSSTKDDQEIQQDSTALNKIISLDSSKEINHLYDRNSQNLPKMSRCVTMWQFFFPWMQYVQEGQVFICKTCNWSSFERRQTEVFKINSTHDINSVAAKLREHSKGDFHIVSAAKYEELSIQCKYQYQALKEHLLELSSEGDVVNFVELMAERKLYTMQPTLSSELTGMSITTRLLAEYIEDHLLNSLKKSSFFSVIAVEEKGYAIVRWLDTSLNPVEHLICSRLRFPDNRMSSLEYLERQQVNLSKLISYSKYPCIKSEFVLPERWTHFERSASPFRIPTITICLEWLKKLTTLRQIYLEVSFICKIAKAMPHNFSRCPNAKMLANVKDPDSIYIVLEQEAINIFLDNINVLKDIARVIYKRTGNLEALGFSTSLCNYISIKKVISILVDINHFLQKGQPKLSELNNIRIRLHDIEKNEINNVFQEEKEYKHNVKMENKDYFDLGKENSNSYIGILDMYLSYVVLALSSPSCDLVEEHLSYRKCSKSEDVESVLYLLDTNSLDRLNPSIIEMRSLFNKTIVHANTILDILKYIKDQPTLQVEYPLGWKLMQAVAVLPFLPAKVEQHMFNIATGESSIMNKDISLLIPALMYIMNEGPEIQDMDEELVLLYWSKSWKNNIQS
ncbi:unnamed protein product [Meganyctiphanes norvegica]|uniref:Uncharacterized protein n=1 Tax=Meganyctiphanes norvegica TaxID=48144 RepID=A0AAV2RYT1_MEGNR